MISRICRYVFLLSCICDHFGVRRISGEQERDQLPALGAHRDGRLHGLCYLYIPTRYSAGFVRANSPEHGQLHRRRQVSRPNAIFFSCIADILQ